MESYRITGFAQGDKKLSGGKFYQEPFKGRFVCMQNDEIIGKISWQRDDNYPKMTSGNSFIKGLFIDGKTLIFVEVTDLKEIKGYSFKDISKVGIYDSGYDWLCGLFSGETAFWKAYVTIGKKMDSDDIANAIIGEYEMFYKTLDEYKMFLLDDIQELRDYIR